VRLLVSIAALALTTTTLVGCDAAEKVTGPDPDKAADALASALATGNLSDVAFAGDETSEEVTADYTAVVEGLGDMKRTDGGPRHLLA